MSPVLAHLILALAIVAAYVALTITGHDANAVLAALGGQGAAAGIQAVTKKP